MDTQFSHHGKHHRDMEAQPKQKQRKMASKENEGLKVVRCTYSELKQLAAKYDKPEKRERISSNSDQSRSLEVTAQKRSNGVRSAVKDNGRMISRQQKNMPPLKQKIKDPPASVASRGSERPTSEKLRKNGLIDTRGFKLSESTEQMSTNIKCVKFEMWQDSRLKQNDYERGLIEEKRLLYDHTKDERIAVIDEVDTEVCLKMSHLRTSDSSKDLNHHDLSVEHEGNPKHLNKKLAENLLADVHCLSSDLDNLVSRRTNSKEQLMQIVKLSSQLQMKCREVMLTDLYTFTAKEIYQNLWRNGIYVVMEKLRTLQRSVLDDEKFILDVLHVLQEFLRETNTLIQSLVTALEKNHKFSLKQFLDHPNQLENHNRAVKMSLISCHHFMIFLGDIERYKQNLASNKDWSIARSYYIKASKIAPKNGKPYNQLAVIAVYAKRRLDAVYYYMRCLTASNPIMTAREKLHAIFDDVQRKVHNVLTIDTAEKTKRNGDTGSTVNTWKSNGSLECDRLSRDGCGRRTTEEGRHELWVFYQCGKRREFLFTPEGLKEQNNSHKEINEEKPKTSLNEINKQFELRFLHCHAMLYSKIGIDHFSEEHGRMLGLLRLLLKHPASQAVRMKRLVEIMAINIFGIQNIAQEDSRQYIEGTPLDLVLNLASDVIKILSMAITDVIRSKGDDESHVLVLTNYVPAVKLWFDWMKLNIDLLRSSTLSMRKEFWDSLALFLNSLSLVVPRTAEAITPGDIIVTLPEDDQLNGFSILAHAWKPRVNVDVMSNNKEETYSELRHNAVTSIASFLCEFEDLPLRFDPDSHGYYVTEIMTNTSKDEKQGNNSSFDEHDIEDDVIIEGVEYVDSDSEFSSPVKELKAKKDALTNEILNQQQREEEAQVLSLHVEQEINVQYLIPDTNCFIDHLSGLQWIVESRYFNVVVPLVVINELDGLAKGFSSHDFNEQQRINYVASQARAAVDFLEYHFSLSDSQLLALTSKGSVLTTIAFRIEESTSSRGINDDIILKCCTYYCDTKNDVINRLATAEKPFTIRRKVALLTDDRNLRLKAHVQNIPVVSVPQFLEMIS